MRNWCMYRPAGSTETVCNERGSILMVSLWMLVILSLVALGLGGRMAARLKAAGYRADELRVQGLEEAGLRLALWRLSGDRNGYDALTEPWAGGGETYAERRLGEGTVAVGVRTDDGTVRYGLIDEERKVDLNTASFEVLLRLPGMTRELANAVLDWRDADDAVRPGGAEQVWYRSAGRPYDCRNGTFGFVEELLLVKGCAPEILEKLKPFVTVYGSGRVNINTAPRETLRALGLGEALADLVLDYRRGIDGREGTADDRVFADVAGIARQLSDYRGLTADESARLDGVRNMLTTVSTCYTVPLVVTLDGGVTRTAALVVDKPARRVLRRTEQ